VITFARADQSGQGCFCCAEPAVSRPVPRPRPCVSAGDASWSARPVSKLSGADTAAAHSRPPLLRVVRSLRRVTPVADYALRPLHPESARCGNRCLVIPCSWIICCSPCIRMTPALSRTTGRASAVAKRAASTGDRDPHTTITSCALTESALNSSSRQCVRSQVHALPQIHRHTDI